MRKLRPKVDHIFETGLQGAEMPVSGKVWAQISSELEKDKLRRKLVWYRAVAAASIVLLLGMGTWMMLWRSLDSSGTGWADAKRVYEQVSLPSFADRVVVMEPSRQPMPGKMDRLNHTSVDMPQALAMGKARAAHKMAADLHQEFIRAAQESNGDAVRLALRQAREANQRIRESMRSRTPDILPSLSQRGDRRDAVIVAEEGGALAELFAAKATTKKEREFTFAVEDEKDLARDPKRWEMAAGFSPEMHFSSTTPVNTGLTARVLADDPTEANADQLTPVVAYAVAFKTAYELDERWSLRSGLTYINRQTTAEADPNASGKNSSYQNNLNLHAFEVPVTVKYNVFHSDAFDYYVTGGASGNFFLHYDNYLQTNDGFIAGRRSSEGSNLLKPSQASLVASTGLRYRLLDRLSLNLEPGMRYGLIKNGYAFTQTKPLSTTLLSGLSYHF
jgi:hypothetical protein